jgi:hypothetical protein
MKKTLKEELETLINQYCEENYSNTPDFILAEFLIDCLKAFGNATNRRSSWYNQNPTFVEFSDSTKVPGT